VLYRRLLIDAIKKNEAGDTPLMVLGPEQAGALTGPPAIDGVGPSDAMDRYWKDADASRRKGAKWAA